MQTVPTARTLGIRRRQVAAGKFDDLSAGEPRGPAFKQTLGSPRVVCSAPPFDLPRPVLLTWRVSTLPRLAGCQPAPAQP
jgi:hypothetical protein